MKQQSKKTNQRNDNVGPATNLNRVSHEEQHTPRRNKQSKPAVLNPVMQISSSEQPLDHQHTMQSEQIPNRYAAFDAKEQNEFMNLNIKQNASDSEDESQQRIF